KQMVTRFGMSEKLGPQTFGEANHEVFLGRDFSANADYSPEIAFEIDKEIRRLIDEGFAKAHTILAERREQLDLMATVLIERETVDKEELEALLNNNWAEFLAREEKNDTGGNEPEGPGEPAAEAEPEQETGKTSAVPPTGGIAPA
ncbi:MAG: ATP-dependent zinc metalloprotease FtsH, partial [Coriobacteriia bacterium]